jgi:hypothetical protein
MGPSCALTRGETAATPGPHFSVAERPATAGPEALGERPRPLPGASVVFRAQAVAAATNWLAQRAIPKMVSWGFTPSEVGNTEPSTTKRLSSPW